MGLLEVYENMQNVSSETEKVAETEKTAEEKAVEERMEVLEKYASVADEALSKEYGEDYTEDDVVKLAQMFIEHDQKVSEDMEKVSELHEAGIIMAKSFKAELAKE